MLAPGLRGWHESQKILSGEIPYVFEALSRPAPDILPANERRRSGHAARLAVAAAQEALRASTEPAENCATVFASSDGDGDIVNAMCSALSQPAPDVSPTRFHNSVHNAPAGYWAIATGCQRAASSVSAYDTTFAAGLIEAATQVYVENVPVLLVAFDVPFPGPLHVVRPVAHEFAVALVLVPLDRELTGARATMTVGNGSATADQDVVVRTLGSNPAAASLPLLKALACGHPCIVEIAYQGGRKLTLDLDFL